MYFLDEFIWVILSFNLVLILVCGSFSYLKFMLVVILCILWRLSLVEFFINICEFMIIMSIFFGFVWLLKEWGIFVVVYDF